MFYEDLMKGKQGEYKIISKLIDLGFSIYVPIVDIDGVDFVIRNEQGKLIEIQVKSRIKGSGYNKEFVVKRLKPRESLFICCYLLDTEEFWFIPSEIYVNCSRIEQYKGYERHILTMDIENERKLLEYNKDRGLNELQKLN